MWYLSRCAWQLPIEMLFQAVSSNWAKKLICNSVLRCHHHRHTLRFRQPFSCGAFLHLFRKTQEIAHILLSLVLEGVMCFDTNTNVDSPCNTMSSVMVLQLCAVTEATGDLCHCTLEGFVVHPASRLHQRRLQKSPSSMPPFNPQIPCTRRYFIKHISFGNPPWRIINLQTFQI